MIFSKIIFKLKISTKSKNLKFYFLKPDSFIVEGSKIENCHIRYPEKLRTLVVNNANEKNLRKFVNLKNLNTRDINSFNGTFFAGLPKTLKRLTFFTWRSFRILYSNRLEDYLRDRPGRLELEDLLPGHRDQPEPIHRQRKRASPV